LSFITPIILLLLREYIVKKQSDTGFILFVRELTFLSGARSPAVEKSNDAK
jgi:hypothetical protein